MSLDPQAETFLQAARLAALPPLSTIGLVEGRLRAIKNLTYTGEKEPVEQVKDLIIPAPGGPLRARHYVPRTNVPLPTILFLHGGGWVVGNLDTHDHVCRALANLSDCAFLSIDYRLAPENKFPAAVEDAWAALNWLVKNSGDLSADPSRLAVAGDSAGATLATVVAMRARDKKSPRLQCQVLIYPPTDHWSADTKSYLENGTDYLLTRDAMIWFWDNYLPAGVSLDNPEVCPLRAADLTGLPPTLVVTAEYDPLRDEAEAYAQRLKAAGVSAICTRYDGMLHGFVIHFHLMDKGRACLKEAAEFLTRQLVSRDSC